MKKKILITGASRGIGRAVAEDLLQKGHTVIGIARRFDASLKNHPQFTGYAMDLTHTEKLPLFFQELVQSHPDVEALICNAGKWFHGHLEQMSYKQIQEILNLNFLSQVFLVRAFLPLFKQRKSGHLIFMGSEAALRGKGLQALYSASKSALRSFVQALRSECATKNLVISILHPGLVATDFYEDAHIRPSEDPLHHLTSEDIAKMVEFILNSRSGCVVEEILMSPQKHRIQSKESPTVQESLPTT